MMVSVHVTMHDFWLVSALSGAGKLRPVIPVLTSAKALCPFQLVTSHSIGVAPTGSFTARQLFM